jgi:multidrug resistance efflux pump
LESYARAWMTLVCRSAEDARAATLLLGPAEHGPFEILARFPEGVGTPDDAFMSRSASVLKAAIERRRPAIEGAGETAARIGYPLVFSGLLHGAVLIEARSGDNVAARRLLRHLQWSAAGLEAFLGREAHRQGLGAVDRAEFLLGAVDAIASQSHGIDAARALANTLARRLNCDSVAVGRYRRKTSRVVAVSQSAQIDRKSSLSRAIEAAQDEAIDQGVALVAPRAAASAVAAAAQERLSRALGGAHVLTVPIFGLDDPVGALTLRRVDRRFAGEEIDLADALGAASGALLEEKWRLDRSVPALAVERMGAFLGKLFGPRHLALKLIAIALVAASAYLAVATDVYRVRARAQIQGETRRMAASPFDGFIHGQFARAGDVVKAGAVLAELDGADLELERLRQIAHKRQYQLELDKALAKHDLAEINISRAQIDESDAEIDLSDQMIARAKLRAPFDAVVVTGDLSQSVGEPVSRGDVLFELAPLDRYRMTALAPESDVGFINAGQRGELLLSALPNRTFSVTVGAITSVAQANDGVNGFEVIAPIESGDNGLRPGMEGVVKIDVGRRNVAWIYLHPIWDWLRIKIWALIP